nr:uncharacterized protein LOC112211332 [Halyomorpha halys]
MGINDDKEERVRTLERGLRRVTRGLLKLRSLALVTAADDDSFIDFEVDYDECKTLWAEYREIWDELDSAYESQGASTMPPDWEADYDIVRNDLRRAEARYRKIKAQRDSIAQEAKPGFATPTYPSQLPNIRIPEFDGELSSWPRFRDTFVALVHNNTQLAPVNKMHYLKSALSGEPASLLAGFPFDASSYQPAWDALVREYNNPRVLASRCLQRVLNHKCPTSGGERAKYASYLAEVGEGIEAFRSLALEDETDVILSTLALRALDPVTRRHFELAHASSEFPTANEVTAFVRHRLMACKLSHELDMQPHSDAPRAKPAGRGKGGVFLLTSKSGPSASVSPGPSRSPPRRTSPEK